MAFAASDRQLDHVHDGLPMTVIARNRNMRAIELEIRLQVVVEEPDPPIDRIMATLAGVAESAVMGLIFGMAIHAGGLDVFEYLRRVAGIAFFVNMFSEQWETGHVVIEMDLLRPRRLLVTICTIRSLCTFMHVIIGVTTIAFGLQGNVIYRLDMAIDTHRFDVSAPQRVFGIQIMIECARFPFHHSMTRPTIRAVMAFVLIVVFVTRQTGDIQLVREWLFTMAFTACEIGVPTLE